MQTHPEIVIMKIFPFGKWLIETPPEGWMQVLGCSASQSTDVSDTISLQGSSWKCAFFLHLSNQRWVYLWNIPEQTPLTNKSSRIKELVWGVFQHLHSIYWSAGLVHRDWEKIKIKSSSRCIVVSDWQDFSCIFMWIPTTEHVHTALANPISTWDLTVRGFWANLCSNATFDY